MLLLRGVFFGSYKHKKHFTKKTLLRQHNIYIRHYADKQLNQLEIQNIKKDLSNKNEEKCNA